MKSKGWAYRQDAAMPYQTWKPFPDDAIVMVKGTYPYTGTRIGPARKFFWGYQRELGAVSECVIVAAKRLDRPKGAA